MDFNFLNIQTIYGEKENFFELIYYLVTCAASVLRSGD